MKVFIIIVLTLSGGGGGLVSEVTGGKKWRRWKERQEKPMLSVTFIEKNPHINGPTQLKLVLIKGELYVYIRENGMEGTDGLFC